MSTEDHVTVQLAAKYGCRPLIEKLNTCMTEKRDCAHEKRLLAHCRMLIDDAPPALKPNKQGVTGKVEKPSDYFNATDCSGPLEKVRQCLDKRHGDHRYCTKQIEDYTNCKMMLANRKSNLQ